MKVQDLFHPDSKFKINTIIQNLYSLSIPEVEKAVKIRSQAFLLNYYLNLSLELKTTHRRTEELTDFINKLSVQAIRQLWLCEGCSISIKLSQDKDFRSYFYYVEEKKLVQLLFLFHEEARDCKAGEAMIRKSRKRLFNLIPLLSMETIQGLHEYSFLEDLTTRLDEILTLEEIRVYAMLRPDLFTKIEFDLNHSDLNYTKTLMTQGSVEWDETKQMLQMELDQAVQEYQDGKPLPKDSFHLRNEVVCFKLDYLLSIMKLFREDQREYAIRKLLNSTLKKHILPVDMEILPIILKGSTNLKA